MTDLFDARRAQLVEQAKNAPSFQSAVFFICYSRHTPCGAIRPDITPEEVFADYNPVEFAACMRRAEALFRMSTEVGAAGYAGREHHEAAIREMKEAFPDFSEACYQQVIAHGMFAMR